MFFGKKQDKSYVSVAMCFILVGAGVFAFGLVSWLMNTASQTTLVAFPSLKVIGGMVIMALGYIQLELGLIREK